MCYMISMMLDNANFVITITNLTQTVFNYILSNMFRRFISKNKKLVNKSYSD